VEETGVPKLPTCRILCSAWDFKNCVVMIMVMVFSAIFNNISVISWQSVLLVEETGVPGENHRPAAANFIT
jgi:prepilin signal peptidase PulO-like enzyme (type II secretory pathway)